MGFLDKAKATATQAMQQGQAKVEQIQQSRQESELYKSLGQAVYRARRHGGDEAAVETALTALDDHFARVAQSAGTSASDGSGAPAGSSAPTASSSTSTPGSTSQEGNGTHDDM